MGIEPTALAWEARVLPLYDARLMQYFTAFCLGAVRGCHDYCSHLTPTRQSIRHLEFQWVDVHRPAHFGR
jgi:hypothetical protein